jgi:hypothetical protein
MLCSNYQILLQLILMAKQNEQSIVLVKNIDHTNTRNVTF